MDRALDIMRIVPSPKMPDYSKLISTQQSIIASVFSTMARVNDAAMRQQADNKLDEILEAIHASDRTIQ